MSCRHSLACLLPVGILLLSYSTTCAQVQDSATVERLAVRLDSTWLERGTRLFLADRIERRSLRWISTVLEFGQMRRLEPFLTGREEILLRLLDYRFEDLLNPSLLGGLLARYDGSHLADRLADDDLTEQLLQQSRERRDRITVQIATRGLADEEAEFLRLLLFSTTLVGIRGVDDLNGMIDAYVASVSPESPLARLADRYLRRSVSNDFLGFGVGFRYRTDWLVDLSTAAGSPRSLSGPGVIAHVFFGEARLDLHLLARRFEIYRVDEPATSVEGIGMLGYDLVGGPFLLMPQVGFSIGSISSDVILLRDYTVSTPMVGLELGSYQLFDQAPHLLLTISGAWGAASFKRPGASDRAYWSFDLGVSLSGQVHKVQPPRRRAP